jgi:hypothetical protein
VVWAYDTNTDTWTSLSWTIDRPALPVDWTPLYHDRSGLLLLYEWPGEALWAYDIDTDSRYQLGLWDPPAGELLYDPAAPDGPLDDWTDAPWPDFYVFHFFNGPASTSWW